MSLTRTKRAPMIDRLAEGVAMHPLIRDVFKRAEASMIADLRVTMPLVLRQAVREFADGEQLRLHVSQIDAAARFERDERIAAALRTGEAQKSIARRERVSLRHVERVSQRINRHLAP